MLNVTQPNSGETKQMVKTAKVKPSTSTSPEIQELIAIRKVKEKDNVRYTNELLSDRMSKAVAAGVAAGLSIKAMSDGSGISSPTLTSFKASGGGGSSQSSKSGKVDADVRAIKLFKASDDINSLKKAKALLGSEEFKLLADLLKEGYSLTVAGEIIDTAIKFGSIK